MYVPAASELAQESLDLVRFLLLHWASKHWIKYNGASW